MSGACSKHGADEKCIHVYSVLVGKPEVLRPLGRPSRALGWEGVDWMHLVQDRD
jgi:hypothetical protein